MRRAGWGAFTIVVGSLLGGGTARAQEATAFGDRGQVVLSAERLFGYVHGDRSETVGGVSNSVTVNAISLVGNTVSVFTVYATPHLAFDFFAANRFSVGGSATYFHASDESPSGLGQPTTTVTFSGFSLLPRVGYAVPLGPALSLWPRLGFTLVRLSTSQSNSTGTSDTTLYALTVEVPVAFAVGPRFFLTVAPTLDLGLGGSTTTSSGIAGVPSTSNDAKETDLGVQVGVGGFF